MKKSSVSLGALRPSLSKIQVNTTGQQCSNAITNCVRKYVLASFRIFTNLRGDLLSNNGGVRDEEFEAFLAGRVLDSSIMIRETLRTVLDDLNCIAEGLTAKGHHDITELTNFYEALGHIEKTWNLCEIYYFNTNSKLVCLEVAKWLKSSVGPVDVPMQLKLIEEDLLSNGQSVDYFEASALFNSLVVDLVCCGRLRMAVAVLGKHSRLASCPAGSTESNALEALTELFHTHPYATYVSGLEDFDDLDGSGGYDDDQVALANRLSVENLQGKLLAWQEKSRRVRTAHGAVLASLGPIMTFVWSVVETGTINWTAYPSIARQIDWRLFLTLKLLYVYAPPLGRQDIVSVIEQCLPEHERLSGSLNVELTEDDILQQQRLLSTLKGDVGPTLRELFQYTDKLYLPLSRSTDINSSIAPSLSLMALICTGHLTFILANAAGLTDLLTPLENSSYGSDFGEEIMLQATELLHELDYPLDVVVGYLQVYMDQSTNNNGLAVAAALLPRTICRNDEAANRLIAVLRDLGLENEAIGVCRRRYSFWLSKNTRHGTMRALYYMDVANNQVDRQQCARVLDAALTEICVRVTSCMRHLEYLALNPETATFNQVPIYSDIPYPMNSDQQTPLASSFVLAPIAVNNVENPIVALSHYIQYCKGLLDSLAYCSTLHDMTEAISLSQYITALKEVVSSMDIMEMSGSVLASMEGSGVNCEGFSVAAKQLCQLIQSETVPIRYCYHLTGLIIWLCQAHMLTNGGNSRLLCKLSPDRVIYNNSSSSITGKLSIYCPLSKMQSYTLLTALTRLETCFTSHRLQCIWELETATELFPDVSSESRLASLRAILLQVYCASVQKENSIEGENIRRYSAAATTVHPPSSNNATITNTMSNRMKQRVGFSVLVPSL